MIETIAIYFTPLASTKVAALVGLGLAYHMAIVYTDGAGHSFGASSGPSASATAQTPALALSAIYASAGNRPSAFGTLLSDPKNNHPFIKGHPEDYYTQDFEGTEYPHVIVATGPDLSAQWTAILTSYVKIGAMHLTYSPISQNSNSMAGTALRRAGIPIPFSVETKFSPAMFTMLPRDSAEMDRPVR